MNLLLVWNIVLGRMLSNIFCLGIMELVLFLIVLRIFEFLFLLGWNSLLWSLRVVEVLYV